MDYDRDYTASCLVSLSQGLGPLHLEYHPGLFIRIPRDHCLPLACEMVSGYHNHLRVYSQAGVWSSTEPTWILDSILTPPLQEACPSPTDPVWCHQPGDGPLRSVQPIGPPAAHCTDSDSDYDDTPLRTPLVGRGARPTPAPGPLEPPIGCPLQHGDGA